MGRGFNLDLKDELEEITESRNGGRGRVNGAGGVLGTSVA